MAGPTERTLQPPLVLATPFVKLQGPEQQWSEKRAFPEVTAYFESGSGWPTTCMTCPTVVSAGSNHVCFVNETNQPKYFGKDNDYQLVPKGYIAKDAEESRHFFNAIRFESLSAGDLHTCAILTVLA